MGEREVHAVCVHLDKLKVSAVDVMVEKLVVELKHAELRELIDHDAHLEGAIDGELALAQLDLVGGADLLEVGEPDRAEMFVHLVLIAGVEGSVLPLHRFDKLAVSGVAEKLEHLCEHGLVLVGVALAAVVRDLLHEPAKDLARLVVGELETVGKVPLQEWGVQENLLRRHDPQQLRLLRETLLQIVVHVLRHRAVGDAAVDEDRRELLELGPQRPGDFDVHFRETEPLLAI